MGFSGNLAEASRGVKPGRITGIRFTDIAVTKLLAILKRKRITNTKEEGGKMQNRKVTIAVLGLAAVAFLALGCVDSGKIKQLENEVSRLTQLVEQKDAKIKTLTGEAVTKEKELGSIKKELDSSKTELDSIKKELEVSKSTLDGVKTELDNTKKELDGVNAQLKTLTAATPVKVTK